MITYTIQLIINRPVHEAFKATTDIDRKKEWVTGFVNYSIVTGIKGQAGCIYNLNIKGWRGKTIIRDEILFVKKSHTYDYKIIHPLFTGMYKARFFPKEKKTELTVTGEIKMMRYRWLEPVFGTWIKWQQQKDFDKLKMLIEY